MKVLYINENRHERVLRAVANPENENIFIIPKELDSLEGNQYLNTSFRKIYPNHQFNLFYRYMLARDIQKIAEIEKPDIIHYVSADDYLRLFGFSLGLLSRYNFIVTLHWCRHTKLRDIARNQICKKAKGIIFHVKNAPVCKNKHGEIKSEFLVLPPENNGPIYSKEDARQKLGIIADREVIAFVGSMEEYKGIEVLMESIKYINKPITLLLAGKPGKYTKQYFESYAFNPNVDIQTTLRYLSDDEFTQFTCAADYIVLPYKKAFEATSGAMTEAIRCGIPIIAPNHENLGILTKDYKLGYTFESENPESLATAINQASKVFKKSESYLEYQSRMSVVSYRNSQQEFYKKIIQNFGI